LPRAAARLAPTSPADQALRMLMLHSAWWDELSADDHGLLHELPAPHGPLFAWLERQLAEQGPLSWASLEQGLLAAELSVPPQVLAAGSAFEDEVQLADLRRIVDGLWIERLTALQTELIARAGSDTSALQQWREVTQRRDALLRAVRPPATAPGSV
jgi:DNA primase